MLSVASIVLLILIGVLTIPLRLIFNVSWPNTVQNDIELKWAFGLVRFHLPTSLPRSPSPKRIPTKKRSRSSREKVGETSQVFSILWQRTILRRVIKYVTDLWNAIHRDYLNLDVRIGLDDPADTGQLWAVIGPISGVLTTLKDTSIRIEPDFCDARLDFGCVGSIRLIPLHVIYLTLTFLLSPIIWRTIRQMRAVGA